MSSSSSFPPGLFVLNAVPVARIALRVGLEFLDIAAAQLGTPERRWRCHSFFHIPYAGEVMLEHPRLGQV